MDTHRQVTGRMERATGGSNREGSAQRHRLSANLEQSIWYLRYRTVAYLSMSARTDWAKKENEHSLSSANHVGAIDAGTLGRRPMQGGKRRWHGRMHTTNCGAVTDRLSEIQLLPRSLSKMRSATGGLNRELLCCGAATLEAKACDAQ